MRDLDDDMLDTKRKEDCWKTKKDELNTNTNQKETFIEKVKELTEYPIAMQISQYIVQSKPSKHQTIFIGKKCALCNLQHQQNSFQTLLITHMPCLVVKHPKIEMKWLNMVQF